MRGMLWLFLWAVGTYVIYRFQMAESQAQYDAGDLSAFAWHGFLPFVLPIFMTQAFFFVVPIVFAVEFALWLRRRYLRAKGLSQ